MKVKEGSTMRRWATAKGVQFIGMAGEWTAVAPNRRLLRSETSQKQNKNRRHGAGPEKEGEKGGAPSRAHWTMLGPLEVAQKESRDRTR